MTLEEVLISQLDSLVAWQQLPIVLESTYKPLGPLLQPHTSCFGSLQAKKCLDTQSERHLEFQVIMCDLVTMLWDKRRWGFAIYRTDYSSEADWTKSLTMFETYTQHGLPCQALKDDRLIKSCSQVLEDGRLIKSWHLPHWMND